MAWYGVVWYGMAFCGMTWYGMVWHGMAWHGMTWYDMAWCGMTCYGMAWCGTVRVWYGRIWYDMIWYDMIWYDTVCCYELLRCLWYGTIWYNVVWYDMIWFGMVRCDPVCHRVVQGGVIWHGMTWNGNYLYRNVLYGTIDCSMTLYNVIPSCIMQVLLSHLFGSLQDLSPRDWAGLLWAAARCRRALHCAVCRSRFAQEESTCPYTSLDTRCPSPAAARVATSGPTITVPPLYDIESTPRCQESRRLNKGFEWIRYSILRIRDPISRIAFRLGFTCFAISSSRRMSEQHPLNRIIGCL